MDEVKLRSVALLILFDQAFSAFAKSWGFLGPQTHFTCANGFDKFWKAKCNVAL
jgi:hypothetical protein